MMNQIPIRSCFCLSIILNLLAFSGGRSGAGRVAEGLNYYRLSLNGHLAGMKELNGMGMTGTRGDEETRRRDE